MSDSSSVVLQPSSIGQFAIGISPIGVVTSPVSPFGPGVLTGILPAYVFKQYEDDDNIQAFFAAFNALAQQYQDWFVNINLPIYTGLSGALLDWVAQGLYGIVRPNLSWGQTQGVGPLNTWLLNTIPLNSFQMVGVINDFTASDDIFKRIITWFFFKGDGQVYSTTWLKRRIMRFLIGISGVAPNIDNTYPISVVYNGLGLVTITITLTTASGIALAIAQIFQAAAASGAISLPFQYSFNIIIINNVGATGLVNNGGVLQITDATGWPVSSSLLAAGAVWDDGGVAAVIPGSTPNPFAAPVFFGLITAAGLLTLGGGNLPLTNSGLGIGQLWNNGGVISIASGPDGIGQFVIGISQIA